MSINLDCIEFIDDYDEAIAAEEDLVTELVEEFVKLPEGKVYPKCPSRNGTIFGELEKNQTEAAKSNYADIVDRHGESPPQYPDWEEWDED